MTPPTPNGDTKTALKTDFYHFFWNFTCHFVNKAYAKKRKNIFYFICTLRITEQKLNLPSRPEEKGTCQETRRATHCGWICWEDAKHCDWICGEGATHCGRTFEARFRLAYYNC